MGNCVETCLNTPQMEQSEQQQQQENLEKPSDLLKENIGKDHQTSGAMRIKIVLTKEELELLLFQLKNKGKRLEDLLDEIERSRRRSIGPWKPSLESITESPEVPEHMGR